PLFLTAAYTVSPSVLMAISNGWPTNTGENVTCSLVLSTMVICLAPTFSSTLVPLAVKILPNGELERALARVSFCASTIVSPAEVGTTSVIEGFTTEFVSKTLFFNPLTGGPLEELLELLPQPASRAAPAMATASFETHFCTYFLRHIMDWTL